MRPLIRRKHGDFTPKPSHLSLSHGGLSIRPTARQLLDRGMKDVAISCKRTDVANSTAYPSRAVAEIAQGTRQPLRVIARIIADELKGGGPVDFGERLGYLLIVFTAQAAAELGRSPQLSAVDSFDKAA